MKKKQTLMKRLFTLLFFLSFAFSAFAADRYWVGASGSTWESTASWSATMGGTSGASVPVANDNVYIPLTTNITIPVTSATTFPNGFNILAISGAFTLTMTYNATTSKSILMNASAGGGFSLASGTTFQILGTVFTAGTGYTNGRLNLSISGGGATTNNIDGTFILAGASAQMVLGSSTTLNVTGTIRHFAASGNIATSGTMNVGSTANMEWYRNGGSVPGATWNAASKIKYFGAHTFNGTIITPITNGTMAGLTLGGAAPYNFPNIEINVPNSSGIANWGWPSGCTVKGSINVIAYTGTGTLRMASTLTNLIVNGDFTTNGLFSFASSGTSTVTVDGSINLATGTVDLHAGSSNMQLIAKGSVTIGSTCTVTESGTSSNSRITFGAASGDQDITQSGTISNTVKLEINKLAGNVKAQSNISMPATSVVSCVSGKLVLGANNLTSAGAVTGTGAAGWVVTDGTGAIKMTGITTSGKAIAVGPSTSVYAGINIVPTATNDFTVSAKTTFTDPVVTTSQVFPCEWNIVSASTDANIEFEAPVGMTCPAGKKVIGHYVGGVWVETVAGSTGFNGNTSSSASFTSFSPFGFGNACGFAGGAPSTAVLAGDVTICSGGTTNLTTTITGGVSPYTLVYSAGAVSGYVSGTNIPVMPAMTTMYSVTSVTDANGCLATTPSGTPTVTITSSNNALVTGNWSASGTWSCGSAPVTASDVTIPMGVVVMLDEADPTINSLTFTGGGKLQLDANSLTVTGTTVGNATDGYVITNGTGKLKSPIGAGATKTFPIGTSAVSYDPVTITPTSSATFDVLVKTPITNVGTIVDITKVVQREWDITRTGTASATNLIFKPDAAALTVANTPSAATGNVGHWNGSAWDPFISSAYATATGWTLTGYTGSFSPFIVAAPDAVLAVELKKVTAYGKGRNNMIEWSTASEKNMKEYIVERSADGINAWEAIKKQTAINKDDSKYSVEDATATALSFYRVKSVDMNGKVEMSKIVSVKRETKGKLNISKAFPNPTLEAVQVDFEATSNSNVTVSMTDVLGRVVSSQKVQAVEGLNRLDVNLNAVAKGMYILTLQEGNNVVTQRIVKQ
jgi:hypothetical protein